jgi:putative exporter of polyketide antibiotics
VLVGARHDVNFTASSSLFLAVAITAAAAMFAAIGALASQVTPTRVRATGLAAAAFGLAFTLRVLGDSATAPVGCSALSVHLANASTRTTIRSPDGLASHGIASASSSSQFEE